MDFYIFIWFFLLLSYFIPKKYIIFYFLWFVLLVFIAGGRDVSVGVDTRHYREMFQIAGGGTFEAWVEPFWSWFCYLFYNFVSSDFNAFLFAVSLISLGILFYVSYRESPNPLFSIFIYYSLHWYTASFNIMRQHFAESIILLSWYFYHQQMKKKSYLLMATAYGFHDSSLFASITYLWNKIKLTNARIFIILLGAFLFGSVMNESILTKVMPSFFEYFLLKEKVFRDNLPIVIILVLAQNLMVSILVKCVPQKMFSDFWFKIFILSCAVFNATYMIAYATRIYTVFAICQVITFPLIVSSVTKNRRIFVVLLLFVYLSAQFFRILLHDKNGLIPYINIYFS